MPVESHYCDSTIEPFPNFKFSKRLAKRPVIKPNPEPAFSIRKTVFEHHENFDYFGRLKPETGATKSLTNAHPVQFARPEIFETTSFGYTNRLCTIAALIKEAKSGCGSNGRDFNSG